MPLLLAGLMAAGCATADPAEAYREGAVLRFRGAGVSVPARLEGCGTGRILTRDDPVDGVAVYRCAHGVTAEIWTRSSGWGRPGYAFENAWDLLPGEGAGWRMTEAPAAVTAKGQRLAAREAAGPVQSRLWLTPDRADPRVVLQVAWRTGDARAQAEARRGMAVLLAGVEIP